MLKKTRNTILSGLAIAVTLTSVTFFSCKKTTPEVVQASNSSNNNPSLNILDKSYTPLVYFSPYKEAATNINARKYNSNTAYSSGNVLLELDAIQNVYNDLKTNFGTAVPSNISPKAIVLYANIHYTNIGISNITGFSVITFNQSNLEHKFYEVKNNGNAQEVTKFHFLFNSYDSNDFSLLLDEVVKNNDAYASSLFLSSPQFKAFKATNQTPVFLTRNLIENGIMNKPVPPGEDENKCEACNDKSTTESCSTDENGESHCTGGCQNKILIDFGTKNNKVVDIDLKKAYDFRDNFLNKYSKSKVYVDYYYQVSYVIGGLSLINLNTFDETLILTKKLYNIADRLQNGNDNEIIINESLKDYLIAAIEDYKTKSNNNEFKQIMNKIKSDINQYKNKTRAQIINELN